MILMLVAMMKFNNSPNMYHSILDDTVTHIKPSEILQMEQKYDNLFQNSLSNINEFLYLMNFHIMRDKLQYMGIDNWDKFANNEINI